MSRSTRSATHCERLKREQLKPTRIRPHPTTSSTMGCTTLRVDGFVSITPRSSSRLGDLTIVCSHLSGQRSSTEQEARPSVQVLAVQFTNDPAAPSSPSSPEYKAPSACGLAHFWLRRRAFSSKVCASVKSKLIENIVPRSIKPYFSPIACISFRIYDAV